ncbi:MAG: sugar phosphate nucleotidyltransferase [Halanaerobiales bacterium]
MKAVIMAGGKGTRLRPLTCDLPKPMVPIVNYPVMEHIIKLLKDHGITDIAVTTYYQPEVIEKYFGSGEKWGVNLKFYTEETPLGTAGSVHNADEFLDETFIVISGDAITDFDLHQSIKFHQEKNAKGTIVLSKEEVPLEYGVVMTNDEGEIIRFLEKPDWGQVFSDTVNTGIYILEPTVFDLYEKGVKFDFSNELFPLMLKNDMNLYGVSLQGYWNDIGNLEEYNKTNFDFLEGKINLDFNECKQIDDNIWVESGVKIHKQADIQGPLYIGENTKIEEGARIEKAVIGKNNLIQPYSSIKKSILWNNNYIGSKCEIRGSVLANNVTLKEGISLFDRTAIGKKVFIEDRAKINPGVKIWPDKQIEEDTVVSESVIWAPRWSKQLFNNLGVVGTANIDITPDFVAELAIAYASTLNDEEPVTVSADSYEISNCLKRAFISGLQTSGINVLDIGDTVTPVARYSVHKLGAQGGVHLRVCYNNPSNQVIEFLNERGANISTNKQKSIEKKYFAEDYNRASLKNIGGYTQTTSNNKKYLEELLTMLDTDIIKRNYFSLVVDYEYDNLLDLFPVFLKKLNCQIISTRNFSYHGLPLSLEKRLEVKKRVGRLIRENVSDLGLIIDHNAEELNLVTREGEVINAAQNQVLISYILLEKGIKKLYLPLNAPEVIESMAARYEAEVEYTPIRPQFSMNKYSEENQNSPLFYPYSDALYSLGLILERMAAQNINFEDLIAKLPDFYLDEAQIECEWKDKGRVMRKLSKNSGENIEMIDGIKFYHDKGWALVIPDSEKPVFHVYAEGEDAEIAESLTGFYLDKVKNILHEE